MGASLYLSNSKTYLARPFIEATNRVKVMSRVLQTSGPQRRSDLFNSRVGAWRSAAVRLLGCRGRDRSRRSCRPQAGLACYRPATHRRERRVEWPNRGMDQRGARSRIALRAPVAVQRVRRSSERGSAHRRDPHAKSVNAVAAIDEYGEMVGNEVFPANRNGLRALERWAKRFPERRWAVEGAGGIGRPVA